MEQINNNNPINNGFFLYKHNNLYFQENRKENNDYISELSTKDKNILDNSLKQLRREIQEMSNNIKKLNYETDKYIKRNNLNCYRSNSLNIHKKQKQ